MASGEGSFWSRTDVLLGEVGDGNLEGEVVVDQPYALVQHERTDFSHPNGGEAKYLENPLKEKYDRYVRGLADDVLGGRLEKGMVEIAEDLSGEVARRAPVKEGTLRGSASPRVYQDGKLVYQRPPAKARQK